MQLNPFPCSWLVGLALVLAWAQTINVLRRKFRYSAPGNSPRPALKTSVSSAIAAAAASSPPLAQIATSLQFSPAAAAISPWARLHAGGRNRACRIWRCGRLYDRDRRAAVSTSAAVRAATAPHIFLLPPRFPTARRPRTPAALARLAGLRHPAALQPRPLRREWANRFDQKKPTPTNNW